MGNIKIRPVESDMIFREQEPWDNLIEGVKDGHKETANNANVTELSAREANLTKREHDITIRNAERIVKPP